MKVTVEVSSETAEKIQAMPDPGKVVEEAILLKEHRDWQQSRMTAQVQGILRDAMREAESLEDRTRSQLLEEFDEVVSRISRQTCQS